MELFKLLGTIAIDNAAANKALDETSEKGNSAQGKLSKAFGAIGKGAAVVGKAIGTAMIAGGTAVAGLVTKSVQAYADYEQLVGGVETLFGNSADKVLGYAEKAYQTAGLSANAYMETVTSFSASLLQSLEGDTAKAAEYADQAIIDMSDNANKMGSSMESIQNAYQGFAKQNYTMLDNLKLGYGGTKEEMERLIADANKVKEANGEMADLSIDSFADITEAIHIVQTEMGISGITAEEAAKAVASGAMTQEEAFKAMGTTAKEASTTISGSISSMKASWENLLVAISAGNGDIDKYINNFVSSVATVGRNILPVVQTALQGVVQLVNTLAPLIIAEIPGLVEQILPGLIEGATTLLISLAQILPELAVVLLEQIPVIVGQIRSTLENQFPQLAAPFSVIEGLFNGVWESAQIIWESVGKPIFDAIKEAFSSAKDALEPFTSAFSDYVTNGGFAKDATEAVSKAVDVLKTAYEGVSGFIETVVGGFKDAVEWGKEHENTVTVLAIAFGTLAAAVGAYNVVQAIKNAGGIVEIAQLAATAIGVGALTVAETAHTVASTVAAAATTAFGAAVAFLTSPITLVIVAIGALIAIGVLLYKNWDEIKAKCSELYSNLKEKFNAIKEAVTQKVQELKDKAIEKFNSLKTSVANIWDNIKNAISTTVNAIKTVVSNVWNAIKSTISSVLNGIKSTVSSIWNGIKSTITNVVNNVKSSVTTAFNNVKTSVTNTFNNIKSTATTVWNNIKNAITQPIEEAKNKIKNIVDTIKGFFSNMNISFPHIPLPHFSISPSGWSVGDLLEGVIPSLSISWYAKAMKNPIIMNSPTIFGYDPATGSLMGGGEAGSEVVSGTDTLMRMIGDAVETKMSVANQQIIKLLTAMLAAMEGGNKDLLQALLAGHTIKINEREFARTVREYA